MGPAPTRASAFLVVEDDVFAARTFVGLIQGVAEAQSVSTIADAVVALDARLWTGCIVDVLLPDGSGLDLLERIRADRRTVPVLIVTGSHDTNVANRAHRLDAACVFKPDVVTDLRVFITRAITARSDVEARTAAAVRSLGASFDLSRREIEVVELVTLGVSRERLADVLGVSENTVKTTVRHLLSKFREANVEGVARAVLQEIVRLSSMPTP